MSTLNDLLHKDMTRAQFLATIGVGVATVFGLGGILKLFGKSFEQHVQTSSKPSTAYGSVAKPPQPVRKS
jgi:hypothetical protein